MSKTSDNKPIKIAGMLFTDKKYYCAPVPLGCGEEVTGFKDRLSAKEYRLSGFCQCCQDKMFHDID